MSKEEKIVQDLDQSEIELSEDAVTAFPRLACPMRMRRDPVVVVPHPHGEDVEKQYRLTRDAHHNSIYTEVGDMDVQEYVNSFATGCSLKSILERCSLMPVHDKVRYLNQREEGVSADLSHMPKDGTEAYLQLFKMRQQYPEVFDRVAKGESLDAVLGEIVQSVPADRADQIQQDVQKSAESEVKE